MNRRFILGLILVILVFSLIGCFEKDVVQPRQPQDQTPVVKENKIPETKLLPDDAKLENADVMLEFEGDGIRYKVVYSYELTYEFIKGTTSTVRIGTAHQIDMGEDTSKDVISLSTEQGNFYMLDLVKTDLKSAISIVDMDETDNYRELVIKCVNAEGEDAEYKFRVEDGHLNYVPDLIEE